MDLMQNAIWKEAVTALFQDQGLSVPDKLDLDINPDTMQQAETFLTRLTSEQRDTFYVGDQEDMKSLMDGTDEASAAHEVLDCIFIVIGEGG